MARDPFGPCRYIATEWGRCDSRMTIASAGALLRGWNSCATRRCDITHFVWGKTGQPIELLDHNLSCRLKECQKNFVEHEKSEISEF